ncbi:MAG TPA: hypothetical protein PLM53_13535 [Spirochaetota bacterium]|nr:hypothetical protein [Spirochaetota bacterium]HQH98117.1 hypothetical protein [Spirochaetota bacterium]
MSNVKNVLRNIYELFYYHFNLPINDSLFYITIIICDLDDLQGQVANGLVYIDSTKVKEDLRDFESVLFHEMIHLFYDWLFPEVIKNQMYHLSEGLAYYYEYLFYCDKNFNYFLLSNINYGSRYLHFGCALAKYFHKNNEIKSLVNNKKNSSFSGFLEEFCEYEVSVLNSLIERGNDFILQVRDKSGIEKWYGFIYRHGFTAPLVTSLRRDEVTIKYYTNMCRDIFESDRSLDLPDDCELMPIPECHYLYIAQLYCKRYRDKETLHSLTHDKTYIEPLWYM